MLTYYEFIYYIIYIYSYVQSEIIGGSICKEAFSTISNGAKDLTRK